MAVQAVVDDPALIVQPEQVKDITACMKGNKLSWDAPDGEWEIVRMGMSATYVENGPALKDGIGLEVDKMSKEHLRSHFDAFIGEIYKRIPEADRKTWKVVVADSYEKEVKTSRTISLNHLRRSTVIAHYLFSLSTMEWLWKAKMPPTAFCGI